MSGRPYTKTHKARAAGMLLAAFIGISSAHTAHAQACATGGSSPHTEAADRQEIEQLTIKYSYLLDHGRANELAELFTPAGVFDNPSIPLKAVGRKAIAEYYAKRAAEVRTTRHVSTNPYLEFEAPDRASGARLITYYRGDSLTPPFPTKAGSVGEYTETFQRCEDGKWRIASRKNTILFGAGGVQPQ